MSQVAPQLPPSLRAVQDAQELFHTEDTVSGVRIEDTWLTAAELEKTSLEESVFQRVDIAGIEVRLFDVSDCIFQACNFAASKFPDASWLRVTVDSGRCSGLQMTESRLKNVAFKNSKLDVVNFRFSRLENVVFEDCVITEVDCYEASLKNVEFIRCTIDKITFANARMHGVDISESTIEGIVGMRSLRGVTMSYDQITQLAPVFATEAGIKIK